MEEGFLKKLRPQIEVELEKAGLNHHLVTLSAEQSSREIRKIHPRVIGWQPTPNDPQQFGFKPPAGSVFLYWAPSGSNTIQEMEQAHASHDVPRLNALYDRLFKDRKHAAVTPVNRVVELLCQAPVFFDFRYDGKTLAQFLSGSLR